MNLYGHELSVGGNAGGLGGAGQRGDNGGKNWENCNSIINKKDFWKRCILSLYAITELLENQISKKDV